MVDFVTGLRCRECQRAFPAEALHVCDYCFGPLEVAYDYERIAASVSRDSIAAGPRSIWRYRDLLPVDDATPVDLGAGFTPLVRADRLAAELGLGELWIKDDTANPTGSFKDRVVSVALTKARQLGFKVAACASTGNLANSVAAHAARAGHGLGRPHPARPRDGQGHHDRRLRGDGDRRRGELRRRQPPLRRADERAPQLGLRQRQRAHLLRRGLQDAGLRDRRAAGLAGPGPRGGADRVGQPADQGGQGLLRAGQGRPPARGARRPGLGRPGRGLLARGHRLPRGAPTPSGRSSPRRSPSRWPSATRPTAGTPWTSSGDRAGRAPP